MISICLAISFLHISNNFFQFQLFGGETLVKITKGQFGMTKEYFEINLQMVFGVRIAVLKSTFHLLPLQTQNSTQQFV